MAETLVSIKWNPSAFKTLCNGQNQEETAKSLGISKVFLSKLISGNKKVSIDRLVDICIKTNRRPNEFFEIVVKNN